jgi:hypothetical protein
VAVEVLASRYASTTSFQSQVPAFGLTALAALLARIEATHSHSVPAILAVVSVIVEIAALITTRRVELAAWWDRSMLDCYEELLPPRTSGCTTNFGSTSYFPRQNSRAARGAVNATPKTPVTSVFLDSG